MAGLTTGVPWPVPGHEETCVPGVAGVPGVWIPVAAYLTPCLYCNRNFVFVT